MFERLENVVDGLDWGVTLPLLGTVVCLDCLVSQLVNGIYELLLFGIDHFYAATNLVVVEAEWHMFERVLVDDSGHESLNPLRGTKLDLFLLLNSFENTLSKIDVVDRSIPDWTANEELSTTDRAARWRLDFAEAHF